MKTFQLTRPRDSAQAIAATGKTKTAQQGADIRFIAGGTTLIDLMKLNVEQPQNLVDLNRLSLDKIEATSDGGLTIGATVRNSELAGTRSCARITQFFRSDLSGATVQIRNMATTAGNLLQRTRTVFPRSGDAVQRSVSPGSGCGASMA
jgi:xanthine dehydrogenase YagS FAD-binding subunit